MDLWVIDYEGHRVEEPGICTAHASDVASDLANEYPEILIEWQGHGTGDCAWADFGGCGTEVRKDDE